MRRHSDYVPLHLHTEYSLLDGSIKIDELVELASSYKMPAVAITDHGNLFGAVEFYRKVSKAGMKPIIGCEVYVAPAGRNEKKGTGASEASFHLILLAKDKAGYRNLINLVSRAYTEGFYYKPRIDKDLLSQYSGGLIGLSACLKGEVPYYLGRDMLDMARKSALEYKHILGPENFYFEIQENGISAQKEVNRKLIDLGQELHIGVAATNDCHYLRKEDARAHDILLCIQTGKSVNDKDRLKFETSEFYFKSPDEMKAAFREVPGAILSTVEIAERCNLDLDLGASLLPVYRTDDGSSPEVFLQKLALNGLKEKFGSTPAEIYSKRLRTELDIINRMKYSSYFLIVWDFIRYAKEKGVPVGPGRGSAAGSLVAYCLGITEIDPIKYNLLFERFLNPERISMPDIDVDFCKDGRDEVISYVADKYGRENVAQIITFGTMAAKAAIRDVGRVMDMAYADVDKIAKLVPATLNITIDESLKTEPQLKALYDSDPAVKDLLDIARRLEGLCRHASTHAAGVVVSPEPITEYAPLYKNPGDNTIVTQYDMGSVEKIGLLKFDFLGLKTLTVIEKTLEYIKSGGAEFSLNNIPFDDPDTYKLLSSGHTTGIFQLESEGMRDILVRMQPNRFEDLIALVALYRPGPMAWIDDFIKRKKGEARISYEMPQLKEILDETYGIILYQEQVMMIANAVAKFSMGQADILRRAMGKKISDEMEQQKEVFIKGAVGSGIPERKAAKLFENMEPFAKYGFNKSHSAAYAFIAYQTAFLKAHFPVEFMAANLSADMDNTDKIVKSISECRAMSIDILPPDINQSGREFKVIGNAIRFGLEAVKGVGTSALESVLEARTSKGAFASMEEFLARVDNRKVNKKVIERLIKAGAFDSFGISRKKAMSYLGNVSASASVVCGLFDEQDAVLCTSEDAVESDEMERLRDEKEALGFYITGHPIAKHRGTLASMSVMPVSELGNVPDKQEVRIAGVISGIKKIKTKNKSEIMASCMIQDEAAGVEIIVFPDLYAGVRELIEKDALIMIKGQLDRTEKGVKVISREICSLSDFVAGAKDAAKSGRRESHSRLPGGISAVEITLRGRELPSGALAGLKEVLAGYAGSNPLYLKIYINGSQILMATGMGIEPTKELIENVENLAGRGAVRLR